MTVDIASLAIRIDSIEARNAARDLDRVRNSGRGAEQQADALSGAMKKLAGVFAAMKIVDAAEALIKTQREFDKLNSSLITATGSVDNASQAFKALQAFASSTPYGLQEVTKAFIQLRNLGLTPSERALNSYGNTASAMGKSLNQMVEAVADAATGEFERLKEFGIKAKQNGDQVSFTFQGVTSNIGNNATAIEKYLIGLGETKFAGGMELQSKTLDGAISNLGDTWEATKLKFSQSGFGDGAYSATLGLSGALEDLGVMFQVATGAAQRESGAVKEAGILHKSLTTVFETVTVLGLNVAYVFTQVGNELGGLAAQAVALASGDLTLAKQIGVQMKADAEQARRDVDARSEAIIGSGERARKAAEEEAAAKKAAGRDGLARHAIAQAVAGQSAEAIKKEMDAYTGLITSIRSAIAANRVELELGTAATDSQKIGIKLTQELASGKLKLSDAHLQAVRAALAEQAATEELLKVKQAEKASTDWMAESAQARNASNATLAAEYELYGKSTDARDVAMIAVKAEIDLEKFLSDQRRAGVAISEEMIAGLEAERDMRVGVEQATMAQSKALAYAASLKVENTKFAAESIADPRARANALLAIDAEVWQQRIALASEGTEAQRLLQAEYNTWYAAQSRKVLVDVDVTRATELLKIMEAVDEAARQAAAGMEASFGAVGKAIGGLTTALTGYQRTQATVAAQLAASMQDAKGDPTKIAQAQALAARQGAQAQIKSYGDMAAASKGFFKENSKGYKLMEATERAFRAYEMAMALESMVKKVFFKEGEVAANLALNATKLTGEAATTGASVALAGTEASAWGITAVVKAMASLPFPLNLAAGAVTLAAVLALGAKVMGGGGGGMSVSQQRQESQGTGSVFGDSTAKSDSIKRSLDLVAGNSSIELSYTQGMLNSLRAIESSLGGLGNLLVRSTGITSATSNIDVGGSGGWVGKIVSSIFGGKTSVQDTGFTLDRTTLGSAAAGDINSYSYADMKKSGGWFSSGKSWTDKEELGAAADAQFAKVLAGLGAGVSEAAKLLGVGGDAFTQRLNSFVIDIGKISLKDLSGTEIQEQLEAVFSKVGDDLAQFGVAGLEQFQQVGEGYFETLTRIATNYANLDSILASSGTSFGQVGMASITARERLIALAGGIDELASAQSSFNDNFLTEAERLAPVQKYVTDQLAALGLQGIDTRDKFKDVVLGLANSGALATEAGAAQYTALLALADAFAKTHAATEDLTKSEQEIADERKDLLQQLDEITKSEAELLAIQRAGIADVNKALFDQVQAAKAVVSAKDALATAYDKEAAAAKTAIEKSKAWITTLNGLNANLALGNQSTLTPEQKYAEARAQFEKTLAAANAGDTTAQSGLSAAEQAFLTASQVVNASDAKYVADYARVVAANEEAAKWAQTQVDLQQASYDVLEKQVSSLIDLKASVDGGSLTVVQAIANLQKAMGLSDGLGVKFTEVPAVTAMVASAAPAIDYSRYSAASNAGSDALVAEVKALREEVKGLRADQVRQTVVLKQSNEKANADAAATVVQGVEQSAKTTVTKLEFA